MTIKATVVSALVGLAAVSGANATGLAPLAALDTASGIIEVRGNGGGGGQGGGQGGQGGSHGFGERVMPRQTYVRGGSDLQRRTYRHPNECYKKRIRVWSSRIDGWLYSTKEVCYDARVRSY